MVFTLFGLSSFKFQVFYFPNRSTWYNLQSVCSSFLEGGRTEKHSLSSCPPKNVLTNLVCHKRVPVNRFISQIPECICVTSHNAPFCNRNVHICAHFCYEMVHCGIFVWCIVGFVRWVYSGAAYVWVNLVNLGSSSGLSSAGCQFLNHCWVIVSRIIPDKLEWKIAIKTCLFSLLKMHFILSSTKWRPFWSSLSVNHLNKLRPRQDGPHFPDDIFKWIFWNENVWILLRFHRTLFLRVQSTIFDRRFR